MEQKEKRSIHRIMRALHRDAGFLILGFVIIYSLSGIVLVYRDTDFMKHDVKVERELAPNIPDEQLGMEIRMPGFKVERTEGDMVYFPGGSYNRTTGAASMTMKQVRFPFNKFIDLHKIMSNKSMHWFTILFGVVLLFMAISSFWMFKSNTKNFKRGIIFAVAGIVITVLLLFL
jgi:hypothetical protein